MVANDGTKIENQRQLNSHDDKGASADRETYAHIASARGMVNRMLLKFGDESQVFSEVCRIAVEIGKIRMAWIGQREDGSDWIIPTACYGDGLDYLCGIQISTNEQAAEAQGPTGRAWREMKTILLQDYGKDPSTTPWQQRAEQYGWKGTASFPILKQGQIHAVLTVYQSTPHAFSEPVLGLLEDLAADVGLALERFALMEMQQRDHQALLASERESQRLAVVAERTDNAVIITDAEGCTEWVNAGFNRMTGYTFEEVKGLTPGSVLQGPETNSETVEMMRAKIRAGESFEAEVLNYHKNGTPYWVSMQVQAIRNPKSGVLESFISIQRDITDTKQREEAIRRLAYFDPLTDLPNRTSLTDQVTADLKASSKDFQTCFIAFLDLDNFKHINDTLGHSVGDKLLVNLASRIKKIARPDDVYARVGGDEFVIWMRNTTRTEASKLMDTLRWILAEPFCIEGHRLTVTCSIGMACYPEHGEDFETLYRLADIAMYEAKSDGRNRWRIFEPFMMERIKRTAVIEADLREAIYNGDLLLYYQPKVCLTNYHIIGVEALLRWNHPVFGWISPAEFVGLAEGSGSMSDLGEWVLRTAATQMKEWLTLGVETRVAVNISSVQVCQPGFTSALQRLLQNVGLAGKYLTCELTESISFSQTELVETVFRELRETGIIIAVDDFGTGFSSLSYLTRFRPEHVKIDRSFIQKLGQSKEDEEIVGAIIDMSRILNMKTIAEGVENKEQIQILRDRGCHAVQGYYVARPMTGPDATRWLLDWQNGGSSRFAALFAECGHPVST